MQQVIIFGVLAFLIAAVIITHSYHKQRRSNEQYAKEYSEWLHVFFELIHIPGEIGHSYSQDVQQIAKLKLEVCYKLRSRSIFIPLTYKANAENIARAIRECAEVGNYPRYILNEVQEWFEEDLKVYYRSFRELKSGSWAANINCRFYQIYRPMLLEEINKSYT